MNPINPTPDMLNAARDMLDVLSQPNRLLTTGQAASIIANVAANVIIGAGRKGNDPGENMGKIAGRIQHIMNQHVTAMLERELGGEAVAAYTNARFLTSLECLNETVKLGLTELPPSQQTKKENQE